MGDGADGCSEYARCDRARSSETREKDMMDDRGLSTMDGGRLPRPPHVVDVEREVAGTLMLHAMQGCLAGEGLRQTSEPALSSRELKVQATKITCHWTPDNTTTTLTLFV